MERLKNIFRAQQYDPDSDERAKALDRMAENERERTRRAENLIRDRLIAKPRGEGDGNGTRG